MALPFEGLAPVWEALFYLCFAVILAMFAWTAMLYGRGHRAARRPPPVPADGAEGLTWVFLVPALNEEVTIRDSVDRLLALELPRRRVFVIDDAPRRTAEILAAIEHPDLRVIRREKPDAQVGQGGGPKPGLPRAQRVSAIASRRSSPSSTPTAACGQTRPRLPRGTSRTPRSAACSRWSTSTTATTC